MRRSAIVLAVSLAEGWLGCGDASEDPGRVGGRRGGVQACLVCIRRFRLRARIGSPSHRFRPPPHRTGQAGFPHPAHREGVIHWGYDSVRVVRALATVYWMR
jgi:hypothetical protein